ncbi:MAG: glycine-rich domain-containing protein, partial [Myxococcota bacterium]
MRGVILGLSATALLAGACGRSTVVPRGTESGACYPNQTCNAGLACIGGVCLAELPTGDENANENASGNSNTNSAMGSNSNANLNSNSNSNSNLNDNSNDNTSASDGRCDPATVILTEVGERSIVVDPDCAELRISLWGGGGGGGNSSRGGSGGGAAYVEIERAVIGPTEILTSLGAGGEGGFATGNPCTVAGGGGATSYARVNGDLVAVAGGGGGGGGADATSDGLDGQPALATGDGTLSPGGSGGSAQGGLGGQGADASGGSGANPQVSDSRSGGGGGGSPGGASPVDPGCTMGMGPGGQGGGSWAIGPAIILAGVGRQSGRNIDGGSDGDGSTTRGDNGRIEVRWATELDSGSDCGDGRVLAPEQCDDGNIEDGDGCDSTCAIEIRTGGDGSCFAPIDVNLVQTVNDELFAAVYDADLTDATDDVTTCAPPSADHVYRVFVTEPGRFDAFVRPLTNWDPVLTLRAPGLSECGSGGTFVNDCVNAAGTNLP